MGAKAPSFVREMMMMTVQVKVSEIDEFEGLLNALGENLGALPRGVKVALKELAPDLVIDDLQKECDEKLQAKQVVKSKLYPGAVVMLASGSAQMTVTDTDGKSVLCAYWNDAECCINYTTTIPVECLILVG